MMQRLFAILFSALLLSVGFSACSGDGCLETGSCIPLASFYKSNQADSIENLTVRGIGQKGDSCILKNEKVPQVYLPLKGNDSICQFEFSQDGKADIVTFQYKSTKKFVSNECGVLYYFTIESVSCTTGYLLDSVVLIDPTLSNVGTTSLKLYFK